MLFPENLEENEYICLAFHPKGSTDPEAWFSRYVKTFDDYCKEIAYNSPANDVFNCLATVLQEKDGKFHRKTEDQYRRKVLYIDLDKKDYPDLQSAYDATKLIKSKVPDLFIHACYDSGHGFHCYTSVETTDQVQQLVDLNMELVNIIGADSKACKSEQIARVPATLNRKPSNDDEGLPLMKEIFNSSQEKNSFSYSLSQIRKKIRVAKSDQVEVPLKSTSSSSGCNSAKGFTGALCTEFVLENGAKQGERNTFLGRIIFMLKGQGFSEQQIRSICQEWNNRCKPPKTAKEVEDEVDIYLSKMDVYKLNGCWWSIKDNRVSSIIKKYCKEEQCPRANKSGDDDYDRDLMVRISTKIVSKQRLKKGNKMSLSNNELLIMSVLYKYFERNFTVGDLREKLLRDKKGEWRLCMSEQAFKTAVQDLQDHKLIEIIEEPEYDGEEVSFDNTIIKISRGMKIKGDEYIEFYYSTVEAFIAGAISGRDYRVFLCIFRNIQEGESCVEKDLNLILNIGKSNISKSVTELKQAQCIEADKRLSKSGFMYNWYTSLYTDKYHVECAYKDNNSN